MKPLALVMAFVVTCGAWALPILLAVSLDPSKADQKADAQFVAFLFIVAVAVTFWLGRLIMEALDD